MKQWVIFIFSINTALDKQCEKIDRTIERLSLNRLAPCMDLYDKIACLNEKKHDLINLRVLYNLMADSITEEERGIMEAAAIRDRQLKERSGKGVSFRSINRVLNKCVRILSNSGYSRERLNKIYPHLIVPRRAPFRSCEQRQHYDNSRHA